MGGGRFKSLIRSFFLGFVILQYENVTFFCRQKWTLWNCGRFHVMTSWIIWERHHLYTCTYTHRHCFLRGAETLNVKTAEKPQLEEYLDWFSTNCIISVHQFAAFTAV